MMITSKECIEFFGLPQKEAQMILWDVPKELEIGVIPKKIYCSRHMMLPLEDAFHNLISTGLVSELKTWDGCFNIRNKRGGTTYSLHAWGLAIDINAAWNTFGGKPSLSKEFVKCFTDEGFIWGGEWKTKDGMHFELSKEVILKSM